MTLDPLNINDNFSPLKINDNFFPFLKRFSENFSKGNLSLNKTCKTFNQILEKISENHILEKISENHIISDIEAQDPTIFSSLKRDRKKLIEMREICALSIAAKERYYDHNISGKISRAFQALRKIIGRETSIEKAQNIITRCDALLKSRFEGIDDEINSELNSKKFEDEINLEIALGIMRTSAKSQRRLFFKVFGQTGENPHHILIAKPNGDAMAIDISNPIARSARYVYKAVRYSTENEPKEVVVISPFFSRLLNKVPAGDLKEHILATHTGIKNEQSQIKKLVGIDGIINTQEPMNLNINGFDFLFAEMDYFPLGNLNNFLASEEGKALTPKQKKHLIKKLMSAVQEVHNRGHLHEDIKSANILIKYDESKGLYEPVIIDWENSCSENTNKRPFSSTLEFWPPEFFKNYDFQNGENKQIVPADIPSTALDIWNLGWLCCAIPFEQHSCVMAA
jgi:serine/threonine protein kinase